MRDPYLAEGVKRQENRPITFFFNGGPSSSSVLLHLGFVGPKRIDIPSDAQDPGAPAYRLKDNPSSLLRVTDLVEAQAAAPTMTGSDKGKAMPTGCMASMSSLST